MSETSILNKVQGYYESARDSIPYQDWRKETRKSWAYYDGNQWTEEEKEKLSDIGQPAVVINKIAAKIDNLTGGEIAGRTRILFRSRSGEKSEEKTARALSDLALYVAERTDQASEITRVFQEGLIAGISWLETGVERAEEGTSLFNRYEDTMHVVWDPTFQRNDYSDAHFVCRERWLNADDLTRIFGEKSQALTEEITQQFHMTHLCDIPTDKGYLDAGRQMARVVEVQYKQTEKRYLVTKANGKTFTTFDKKIAHARPDFVVESDYYPRIYIAYFSGKHLLKHKPLAYQHGRFTLVPYIFKRDKKTGQPYGIVRHAIDPQRELNKRRSKAMHLLSTAQVIADIDAVEDPVHLAREAARPDGLILKRPGKELRIIRNGELAASQVSVMDHAARDIQEVTGIFDETIGKNSNATSGIAIQQRQQAGSLNQMFAFDALRRLKKQLGIILLSLIRQYFDSQMVIQITDQLDSPRTVRLNEEVVGMDGKKMRDASGDIIKVNDVTAGIFDVVVDEVKDVMTSRELEMNQLDMLLRSGVPVPPEVLVNATNLHNKQEILNALEDSKPSV